MPRKPSKRHRSFLGSRPFQPVSLRTKLLVGFSVVFTLVFSGAFYWFYSFTTEKVIARLRSDMLATLTGASQGVDVPDLMALYQDGVRNEEGFSDDPRYLELLSWFNTVNNIEPRAWLYTYAIGTAKNNRRVGPSAVHPNELEIIYLVDVWALHDPDKAAHFLEPDEAGIAARRVHLGDTFESDIYKDKWGTWMSAFAPLKNQKGEVVAVLGLDIEASYVRQLQAAIRQRFVIAYVVTYGVFFALIYLLSGMMTRHLRELTRSAEHISAGDYRRSVPIERQSHFPDELDRLAQVFEEMVESIRIREQLIREGKRAQNEMQSALQEERELNELKSRFISMISHELRTPLTVIRTSLELLERYGHVASAEQQQKYYQRSRNAVETMSQLIDDVLMIGKGEADGLEFTPTRMDVRQFCRELSAEIRQSMGNSHVLVFSSTGWYGEAYFDPKLLRSILNNLLSNAVKYSPAGSRIDFTLCCQDEMATFEVRDAGIGIPMDDQPRLFEMFHRASNVNAIRGTGLGLAIVRQCVVLHGGTITFSSQEGKGTCFTVALPILLELPQHQTLEQSV
ncbi:HAMP domain-containing sensor histidine kinase [Leptolyngbya sp. FACHB-16]|uniref:sensor histidine kinase n=1 Tax=Leptolyngbya sp. FACHB-16 TaxID=2692800 RepID=UPI001F5545FB|nr:HAMP domain-containing sensor histidine kinase [Leptolyngbya sp. FACHB-16]